MPQDVTILCGELLPHLFTLTRTKRYKNLLAAGGLFSVALSRDYSLRALPGVLPLRSPDFPPQ